MLAEPSLLEDTSMLGEDSSMLEDSSMMDSSLNSSTHNNSTLNNTADNDDVSRWIFDAAWRIRNWFLFPDPTFQIVSDLDN